MLFLLLSLGLIHVVSGRAEAEITTEVIHQTKFSGARLVFPSAEIYDFPDHTKDFPVLNDRKFVSSHLGPSNDWQDASGIRRQYTLWRLGKSLQDFHFLGHSSSKVSWETRRNRIRISLIYLGLNGVVIGNRVSTFAVSPHGTNNHLNC